MAQKAVVAESAQSIPADSLLERVSIHAAQATIYPFLFLLRLLFVRNRLYRNIKKLNLDKISPGSTFVLYANHQSKLDPLIICGSLPFRTVRQLLPFNFFVANQYFKGPMKTFLNMMGGFPAFYHATKTYGLDKARALMASNQTIVIFPQGRRTREHIAKPGISVLATEPNTYLIPVHIEWKHRWHCHVHIGTPIKGGLAHHPDQLMEQVYALPLADWHS
jgi:1-acyl-sn-glycerol-3-phosphate acyltransferase